jgi:hypothetical protein
MELVDLVLCELVVERGMMPAFTLTVMFASAARMLGHFYAPAIKHLVDGVADLLASGSGFPHLFDLLVDGISLLFRELIEEACVAAALTSALPVTTSGVTHRNRDHGHRHQSHKNQSKS